MLGIEAAPTFFGPTLARGKIIFFAVVTGTYTIYGGLRSAAWTDFMQVIILGIGGVLVPILGLRAVGGFSKLFHENPEHFQIFLPTP